jgi:hypothetical protein
MCRGLTEQLTRSTSSRLQLQPRIPADLAYAGVRCGRERLAGLMRAAGLQEVPRRKSGETLWGANSPICRLEAR